MESSIALHKSCEKEQWELKGYGCITSEDLFWKLDALQSFIRDLHWPDEVFAKHLKQRLKLIACDMLVSFINRYRNSEKVELLKEFLRDQTEIHSVVADIDPWWQT